MGKIRIGVNALYLIPGGVGGTEIYLRNLLIALAAIDSENEYHVFTNRETGPGLVPEAPNFRPAPQPVRAAFRPARLAWEQLGLPAPVRFRKLDVLFNPGFTAPAHCACPTVTVFHDLQHKRYPEHFRWFDLPFWNLFLWQAARTSRALIAVSQATATDLEHFYPATRGKIEVVHHGVEERFFAAGRGRGETEPVVLCVSTLHPHKNLERLIRVFARFRERRGEYRIVLAGMRGFHATAIETLIEDLKLSDAVELTGWIPREQLCTLYGQARAVAYPSTFEGFGLPVLEALAAGVPTACSSIPPLREVAGDASLLFDPEDEEAMLSALDRVTSDATLRERLAREGPSRAGQFSWAESARKTLAVLRRAADRV